MTLRTAVIALVGCISVVTHSYADPTQGLDVTAASTDQKSGDDAKPELAEIIVTAEKRSERAQEVPVPLTVIDANALVESNQLRLQDYFTSIPGLSVTPGDNRGDPNLSIRGVTTGGAFANPTVGIVIDDIPIGASTGVAGGAFAIDLDPSELAQVEVLRGPQGTLYGASSIGGLVKYVTVDPSTEGMSARLYTGADSIYNGAHLGYNSGGSVNLPLSETWALRASAFARQDPGYVDDPSLASEGVNKVGVEGGRLSALWKPSPSLSLKLGALVQEVKQYGSSEADPSLGDLSQNNVRGSGTYDKTTQVYSAILNANVGSMQLTSLSGYSINKVSDLYDYTQIIGPLTLAQFGVSGSTIAENFKTTKWSQEFRLSGQIAPKVDWLLGLYATYEKTPYVEQVRAQDAASGEVVGLWINADSFPTTFKEYAAFTNVTVHFTDRFDVQLGGRESQNRQTYMEEYIGIGTQLFFGLPSPIIQPEVKTEDNAFTYLVTPRLKLTQDLMLYMRFASGYRTGGPNTTCSVFGVPCHFNPDTTNNYEIGAKGDFLDHKISFDASAYYINWKDIQLELSSPLSGAVYFANASRAKSQGLELSAETHPLTGLKIASWVAWNDAVLTAGFPSTAAAYGVAGDRLPFSARFSANVSVDQEFRLSREIVGDVGGSVSEVGDRVSVFTQTPVRQDLPAYTKIDLRAGIRYGTWSAHFFVDNLADRRGTLSGGIGATDNPLAFTYIQPRTVGGLIAKTF